MRMIHDDARFYETLYTSKRRPMWMNDMEEESIWTSIRNFFK